MSVISRKITLGAALALQPLNVCGWDTEKFLQQLLRWHVIFFTMFAYPSDEPLSVDTQERGSDHIRFDV
jgi:hypothetical protein